MRPQHEEYKRIVRFGVTAKELSVLEQAAKMDRRTVYEFSRCAVMRVAYQMAQQQLAVDALSRQNELMEKIIGDIKEKSQN